MTLDAKRRLFLKGSMAVASVGLAVAAGLLSPRTVLANWNAEAFGAENLDAALQSGFGSTALRKLSGTISIPWYSIGSMLAIPIF